MKICFLAEANSIHSYRWIKYFADKGHEVHWLSLGPLTVGSSIPNVNFYEIQQSEVKIFFILRAIFWVRRLIKEINPEILHAHYAGTYGLLGALGNFYSFVVTAWGSDVLIAGKSKIKRPLIKFTLNRADLITTDAYHMTEAMVKLGIDKQKIQIICFGIDTHKFSRGEKNIQLKQTLGAENSPVVISLRNLEPIYDVETLIKAIPLVLRKIPEVKFLIAGKGSQEQFLKNLAKSLGITEAVKFIGFISNEDLPMYLQTADIYISTSLSDAGISASTAEAMACGLPVVITDSSENRMWVKDGESGFVVPAKSPEILANRIIVLLRDNELKHKFGILGRKIIEERNNYYKEMEKMEKLYEKILGIH